MSDENTAAPAAPAQAPSAIEQMIPKSRLDELIAQRNQAENQAQFLQQTLSQMLANQRAVQRQEEESPEDQELRQRDPAAYNRFKRQETELKQVRAGFATQADQLDRQSFLQNTGTDGKKRIADVEKILENERRGGNFRANREGIYTWMLGQERLREDATARSTQRVQPKATAPDSTTEDVPTSDPREATTITGGTAPSSKAVETREDRIKKLENIEF